MKLFDDRLNTTTDAGSKSFYFDCQDGKYGYNTSPLRGADTFSPFNSGSGVTIIKLGTFSFNHNTSSWFTADITQYTNDYASLTINNFFPDSIAGHYLQRDGRNYGSSFSRNYDPSTGIVKFTARGAVINGLVNSAGSFNIYLVF